MIDKIYENDNLENQQIFHDIEQNKKFSNYSLELNQTFGDKSYDKFYKSLMEHKKARGLNFISMFQKPKNSTGLKTIEEPFNIEEFKTALKNMKKKNDKLIYRIKNPYKTRPKFKSLTKNRNENDTSEINQSNKKMNKTFQKKFKNEKENVYLPVVPEVGRYHPIYKVLDKHTYQVAFSQQNFYEFNKEGNKRNSRSIFNDYAKIDYNYNDKPLTLDMEKKIKKNKINKIKPISIETINNMSKTFNKNANYQNEKENEIRKSISNHYNTSTSLGNSINIQASNISNSIIQNTPSKEITKSNENNNDNNNNQMTDSQIFIRTNGDIHGRCPKRLSNLYFNNTNSSLTLDESLFNTDSFNSSNNNPSSNPKNNHCLKFETYTKRKPMIRKFNYIYEDFMNTEAYKSIFPAQDNNICLEFNKLSTAKDKQKCFFEVEANKNKNPPLGTYFPKYGHAFKKTVDVYIDKKSPPVTNKRRLKEIILRYDVPTNYLLFDTLNEKKNKKEN